MKEELQIGNKLRIRMELPSRKIINAQGKVVWINESQIDSREEKKTYDMGIEFIAIRDEDREEINKLVLTSLPSKKE
jgi:Tfp pilus assembly protein PilZ